VRDYRKFLLLIPAILIGSAAVPKSQPAGWKTYASGRGAFQICYPPFMRWQGEGEDRMSTAFLSSQGNRIDASGYFGEETLKGALNSQIEFLGQKNVSITYRAEGTGWAAASGIARRKEFYIKIIKAKDRFVTMSLSYDFNRHKTYSRIINILNKCFIPIDPGF
jgi:hypothetical protein